MANWLGKAGIGMNVSCVALKQPKQNDEDSGEGSFKKRTYITFIGKANQEVGAVMGIYQSELKQVKKDFPSIRFIKDKSDNAGMKPSLPGEYTGQERIST